MNFWTKGTYSLVEGKGQGALLPSKAFEPQLEAETAAAAVQQFPSPSWATFLRVRRHSDLHEIPSYYPEVFCVPLAGCMPQLGSPTLGYIFIDATFFSPFLDTRPCSSATETFSRVVFLHYVQWRNPIREPKGFCSNQGMIFTSCVWTAKISKSALEGD